MWSGTSGYALDQSDYRIHESPISTEWLEGWNLFFICIDIQRSNHLIQTYIFVSLEMARLSKVHTRYFQNDEFSLYISRINECMKQSFHILVGTYRSNLVIKDISRTS